MPKMIVVVLEVTHYDFSTWNTEIEKVEEGEEGNYWKVEGEGEKVIYPCSYCVLFFPYFCFCFYFFV